MSDISPDPPSKSHAPDAAKLSALAAANPDDVGPRRKLGWAHYGAGEFDAAAETFREALTRFPADLELTYGLAMALKKAGDGDGAREAFEAVLRDLAEAKDDTRSNMLRHLARQHLHHLEHGRWGAGTALSE